MTGKNFRGQKERNDTREYQRFWNGKITQNRPAWWGPAKPGGKTKGAGGRGKGGSFVKVNADISAIEAVLLVKSETEFGEPGFQRDEKRGFDGREKFSSMGKGTLSQVARKMAPVPKIRNGGKEEEETSPRNSGETCIRSKLKRGTRGEPGERGKGKGCPWGPYASYTACAGKKAPLREPQRCFRGFGRWSRTKTYKHILEGKGTFLLDVEHRPPDEIRK